MSREIVLGVDFGTSYTSAGAIIDGQVHLVLDSGDAMIPSVVYLPERGAPDVGGRAVPHLLSDPTTTVTSVKRLMGARRDDEALRRLAPTVPFGLGYTPGGHLVLKARNQDWAPEQIAGYVLARVRTLAEQRFGAQIAKIVATASAVATPAYQSALRKAARLAYLEIVEMVAEPIAGALAVGMHAEPDHRRLVVCDFGGGTFDVTLIEQRGRKFSIIGTGGDPFLGGDDLDQAMVGALAGLIYRRSRFDLLRDAVRRSALTMRCESVKRALTTAREARLQMRDAYVESGEGRDLGLIIERSWVEPLWDPLFGRAIREIEAVLGQCNWKAADVDEVALIGGSSLVPRFQDHVRRLFPKLRIAAADNAHVAVATGATLLASRHQPGAGSDVPVLQDLRPLRPAI
ncbi:MAG TPA: Hsp70 family protein [Kofleriaceae bacterium]|nr:Hsp70 family protein [Kofleriaceae bacterium]